ncbi:MAG TPA: family 1 glycosylhydrolase, partial [Iamia sp.]|nr:family 1 glycosylhydrolase [Iamia sp.]
EDVDLMAALGVGAYRFSIAWPRVQPGGTGPVNERGMDFYRALVDRLLARGITPIATLYHWDLPSELETALGGWPSRDVALRFADYAVLVGAALGDRVAHWRTINEPWCSAMLGYAAGIHAPGRRSPSDAVAAAHHLLLGHGLAVAALRSSVSGVSAGASGVEIGLTINPYPVVTVGRSEADADVARRVDGIANRLWLDPVLRGAYPSDLLDDFEPLGFSDVVLAGDLDVISAPIDALGLNYYRRHHVRSLPGGGRDAAQWPGTSDVDLVEPEGPHTDGGWAIEPDGLSETLAMVAAYDPPALYVEECGAAFDEPFDDAQRVAFLRDHLRAAHRSLAGEVDLRGWFVWTFFDNFEWAEGFAHRFGIVHVDHDTFARTPKASARWYADVMRTGRVD